MARIAGVDLPNHKVIGVSLTRIFGIGINTSRSILEEMNIANIKRYALVDITPQDIDLLKTL